MTPRNLIALAAVAALVLYSAFALRKEPDRVSVSNAPLLPALATSANDVSQIQIRKGDTDFALERTEAGWGVSTRDGYPADIGKVREFVQGLSELKILEKKTKDPARYDQLSLGDPESAEAGSVRYTLLAADATLAEIVVGKTQSATADVEQRELYVRTGDDPQTYLVQGAYTPGETVIDWLDDEIMALDLSRIEEVRVEHGEADPVLVKRGEEYADEEFVLADVPEGYRVKSPSAPRDVVSAFTGLDFEDVFRDQDVDYGAGITATVESIDGMRVRMQSGKREGDDVARFTAMIGKPAVVEKSIAAADPSEDAASDEAADANAGENTGGDQGADAEDSAPVKSEAEIAAEIASLNEKWAGWVFKVRDFKFRNIAQSKGDMIEAIPESDEVSETPEVSAPQPSG